MYEPAYRCDVCGIKQRAKGVCCLVCQQEAKGASCGATMFVDGDRLYIRVLNVVSESEAVTLMQEYAA